MQLVPDHQFHYQPENKPVILEQNTLQDELKYVNDDAFNFPVTTALPLVYYHTENQNVTINNI